MTDSFMLKYAIHNKGIKIGKIAEALGLSRAGLYNKINGQSEFFGSEIIKISEMLELSTEERERIFFTK